MSRALDVLADAEHGTVEGYRQGCRTSHCPGTEFGLSCIRANTLAAGNWQYLKAVKRGLTPREIADELGLTAPVDLSKEKTVSKAKKVEEAAGKPSQKEVRTWARSVGIDVPARGTLPRAVFDAFNARGKGVQASDVKPVAPDVALPAAIIASEPEVSEEVENPVMSAGWWMLPLTPSDLREIADALEAFERVPFGVVQMPTVAVTRPGDPAEVIGEFRLADGFDDDPWFGFVPVGGAA